MVRRAFLPAFEDRVPFVTALVALVEDPAVRLCTYVVGTAPDELVADAPVAVSFRPLEFTTLVEKLSSNFDWDAMVMGFTGGVEPHNASNLLRSSGNLHLWQPNQERPATAWEADIDHELDLGARELDVEARKLHYWRIQEILHKELPLIQLVRQEQFVAYKSYLDGFDLTVWGPYRPERIAIRP